MIRVVIADDHVIVRDGLEALLDAAEGIGVVAVAAGIRETLAAVSTHRPDVVVVDASMAGTSCVELTASIRAGDAGARVVVLSTSCEPELILGVIEAGAVAYVLQDCDPAELVQAVRAAAAGDAAFSPRVAKRILEAGARPRVEELTPRARQVLALVGQGLTNQRIALRLGISEKTVKAHLGSIFDRLGVSDRVEAALWAQARSTMLEAA